MDLSKISLIQSIADKGSISAAASERYISTVSAREQLGLIEDELGFPLFFRSRRGVSLTPEGSLFLKKAPRLLKEFETLITECRALANKEKESITIAVYEPYDLVQYCNAYRKFNPNISFSYIRADFGTSTRPASFMDKNRINIMQEAYNPLYEQEGLCFLPLYEDYYCLYCIPSHPLSSKEKISLQMLQGLEVYLSDAVSCEVQILEAALLANGVQAVTVPHSEMEILALCGNGAVYLLDSEMQDSFRQLTCIPLEPKHWMVHGIVYAKDAPANVMKFIHFLKDILGREHLRQLQSRCEELAAAYMSSAPVSKEKMHGYPTNSM